MHQTFFPMQPTEISTQRLINQQLAATACTTPAEVVKWLGAVQAQDYAMAKWALASRLPHGTHQEVEAALNRAEIIRIHILRPTWHFVAAADVRWMLALTAPHVKRAIASLNRKLALDDQVFARAHQILIRCLEGGKELTRQELTAALQEAGTVTDPLRTLHILFDAELSGIVCNGASRGKQITYALLDEKVPAANSRLTRDEALAKLAGRYFSSHGPATMHDFAWWSGLPMADVRLGLELVKPDLLSATAAGKTYWFADGPHAKIAPANRVHLLAAFDEFLVGYRDRSASLPPPNNKTIITNNGIFRPAVVVNSTVVGRWKAVARKTDVSVQLQLFDENASLDPEQLAAATAQYANAYSGLGA